MRWLVALLAALVTSFIVLAALGSVGTYEAVAVLAVTLAIAWYAVVHRANRGQ